MSASDHLVRPPTPAGFDASRTSERAADPRGWRYGDDARGAVHRVIADRRDIRRFRPDEVPEEVLRRALEPPLDLRLRLGEAAGGLLALPIIEAAGALHREMATFAEARVDCAPTGSSGP